MGFEQLDRAWRQRRQDPSAALHVAETVRDRATAEGDAVLRARALTLEGACHLLHNDHAPALHSLLEAVALLEDGPAIDRARALSELGQVEAVLGDVAVGMEHMTAALRIHEDVGDAVGAAVALNRLGVGFYSSGELTEARHAYERCLAIQESLDDEAAAAGVRNNLAKVATAHGDLDVARTHLTLARAGFEAAGEHRGVAMVEHNVALVDAADGRHGEAVRGLRAAIDGYDGSGHVHGAIEARIDLARLCAGDDAGFGEARRLLERAHDDAERLGLPGECADAAEALADLHERGSDAAGALHWLRHLREVERRLFDAASDQRLRALQVRFKLERVERDSLTDALTGLLNRRGLDIALAEAVERRRQDDDAVCALMIDLDDFKQINDGYSHAVGDEVLREVADRLRGSVRPSDACGRFGGEEFAVVLSGCDLDRGVAIAEQIRGELEVDVDWARIAPGLRVTTSIGVAMLGATASGAALLASADRALYAAKRGGKNRVRVQR
ncbi:MAG TPA: tetratricopeptide repeat-containing diguanylate cyclase [Egicoccus sp.]|nr:tetratricopeptide repeat-containing diguanylate cyclase [Egicoccus sp.]HSK22408.1 tetratricopeptide repeat-containing diguanylate cyclase [Egicoccus sp.]